MAVDFNKALNQRAGDVERPPIPPIGTFVWQIVKVPTRREGDNYFTYSFPCRAVSVFEDAEDVDPEALAAYGKVTSIFSTKQFFFNTDDDAGFQQAMFNMTVFLRDHLGIENAEEKSVLELLNDCVNKRFVGEHRHRPNKENPESPYSEIGRTAPVDA